MRPDTMPRTIPVTSETANNRSINRLSTASRVLAVLMAKGDGREHSLRAIAAKTWQNTAAQSAGEANNLILDLQAECKGTGVVLTVRDNPYVKGDKIVSLSYRRGK